MTPSTHRLRRGLPGYLILFAPHAFASQRQCSSSGRLRHRCSSRYLRISPLHRGIPPPSPRLKPRSIECTSRVEPWAFTSDLQTAYTRFTPSNSEQRLHPLYYRGCWHRVSRCLLWRYRHHHGISRLIFSPDRALQPEGLHHSRGVAASGFRPLRKIPHCCLP